MMDTYKGKNIIFVKYSVDEDRKRWLEYIQKNEPAGPDCLSLVSENGMECNLLKDYKFTAIPHYLFFDARGRIINIAMDSPGAVLHYKYLDKYLDDPEYQWDNLSKHSEREEKFDLTLVTFDKDFNVKGIRKISPDKVIEK